MKSFVCGRFILELALAHIRSGPISQFRVGRWPKENEIIEERDQDRQFCAQGTPEERDEQQSQAEKRQPFELQRQNKKDVDLNIRIKRGERKKKGGIQQKRRNAASPKKKGRGKRMAPC